MIYFFETKKLDSFLSHCFLKIFARVFLVATVIAIITFYYGAFNYLCDREIGARAYFKICSTFYISILPYIFITSIIFSSTFISHNLNTTFELYALQSLGISFFKMLTALLKPVLMIFSFSFLITHYLYPQATFKIIDIGIEIIKKNPTAIVKPHLFTKDIKGICFYAEKKISNSSFRNVVIYKNDKGKTTLVLAEKATIENKENNYLCITLEKGSSYTSIYDSNMRSETSSYNLSFEKQIIHIDLNNIFFSLGLKQDDPFFKDSLTLYKEISEQKKILKTKMNTLFNKYKKKEEGSTQLKLLRSFFMTPEENSIINNEYYTNKDISEEKQKKNIEKMQEIGNKIRTYEEEFKERTKHARENLMHRDSLALSCLILFLLCFSLGFLLHHYSHIKLLLLAFFISICFFASLINLNVSSKNFFNIYIKYFGHILIFIPASIFSIYYANRSNLVNEWTLKNKIKKYKNKMKNKAKALIIKLWECL